LELQVTWPSLVAAPIKLPWPFFLRTVLVLFVICVDGYVNHSSETVYSLVEIPFAYQRNNLFLAHIYPMLPCIHLMVEKVQW
jgi:hypothetical protein